MRRLRQLFGGTLGAAAAIAVLAAPARAQGAADEAATSPAITPADLRTRVGIFAHDSMQGREAGTPGHDRAVRYIVAELERLGLEPAGENGTYFQAVPLVRRGLDPASVISVDGRPLETGEFLAIDTRSPSRLDGGRVGVVFGGFADDSTSWISAEQAAGRFVVFLARSDEGTVLPPTGRGSRFEGAAAVAATGPPILSALRSDYLRRPRVGLGGGGSGPAPARVLLSQSAAERLLGRAPAGLEPGTPGKQIVASVAFGMHAIPSNNVVAILPGADAARRGQYVALGAHSDHDGVRAEPLDHDSMRQARLALREWEAANPGQRISGQTRDEALARAAASRTAGAGRPDSIYNGADDDASGSMALLEIAEAFSAPGRRPARSLLFVWHTAEEKGLIGARWFTDHPTVPLDSIVGHINLDMIGRGSADDLPGGGPDYLQLLGSRRLSTELGDIVEAVNARRDRPFRLDYTFDAPGHPENYYCRSDHAMYARYGIPVVFFSTGDHVDYHQITDEAQYIDYDHYADVVGYVADVAGEVADLEHRLVVDQPKPDPNARCRQ